MQRLRQAPPPPGAPAQRTRRVCDAPGTFTGAGYIPATEVAALLGDIEEKLSDLVASTRYRPESPEVLVLSVRNDGGSSTDYLEELKTNRSDAQARNSIFHAPAWCTQ